MEVKQRRGTYLVLCSQCRSCVVVATWRWVGVLVGLALGLAVGVVGAWMVLA